MTINAYKGYSTRKTPQSQPVPGRDQVENRAGGYVFELDNWARLQRFLILGSDSATYYASAQTLTKENADVVVKLLKEDGRRVVDTIIDVSCNGRAPKNEAAIFALAMAAGLGDGPTRAYALGNLYNVCRIGTHLFHFAGYVEQFRGWGRGLRRAVGEWYNRKEADRLAYQVVKYQQRDGWSNKDLLKLAHPKPASDEHNAIYSWIINGWDEEAFEYLRDLGDVPKVIRGYEWAKREVSNQAILEQVKKFGLTREMIPTQWLNEPEVWNALLQDMPYTAMIRNLGKMSQVGLLAPMSDASRLVIERLHDQEKLHRARIHPVNVLVALKTYESGKGFRGSLRWQPVPQIVDALDHAFYASFKNVEPTGKRFLLALDVSGSMGCSPVGHMGGLTPRDLAAAMSMTTARTEHSYHVVGFQHDIVPLTISPRQRLDDIVRATAGLPFGGTDCAQPMLYAQKNNIAVDVFIIYTDSETWSGNIHPFQALQQYRQVTGIPAKLIVAAFTSNGFTIADPNDAGMLDIVGADSAIPQLIRDFSAR